MKKLRDSLFVTIIKICSGIATVLLYSLYSFKLSPEELGLYELALTAVSLISIVMSFGFVPYAGGEFARYPPKLVAMNISKLNFAYVIWSICLAPIIYCVYIYIVKSWDLGFASAALIIFIASLQYYKNIYTTTLQHTFRPVEYSIVEASYPFLNLLIISVLFFLIGFAGISWALLANFVSISFVFFLYFNEKKFSVHIFKRFEINSVAQIMKLTYPWFFVGLLNWLMYSFDKFVLEYFTSSYQVGLYAQIYKLSSVYNALIISTVSIVYSPVIYKSFLSSDKCHTWKLIKRQSAMLAGATLILLMVVYLFGKSIYEFVVSEQYYVAFEYCYLIVLQFMLVAITGYFSYVFYFHNITKHIQVALIFGSITNLLLSFVLTPAFNVYGLLIASNCAQGLMLTYVYFQSKRIHFTNNYKPA